MVYSPLNAMLTSVLCLPGISPQDFDNQTLAVLRGRLVRYLMRSKEVSPLTRIYSVCFDLDNDNLTEKCMCGHCKPPLFLPPNVEKNFVSDLDLIIFFTSDFRFLLDQISSKVLHYISKDDQSWLQIDLKDELIQYSMCPSFNVINIMMTFC